MWLCVVGCLFYKQFNNLTSSNSSKFMKSFRRKWIQCFHTVVTACQGHWCGFVVQIHGLFSRNAAVPRQSSSVGTGERWTGFSAGGKCCLTSSIRGDERWVEGICFACFVRRNIRMLVEFKAPPDVICQQCCFHWFPSMLLYFTVNTEDRFNEREWKRLNENQKLMWCGGAKRNILRTLAKPFIIMMIITILYIYICMYFFPPSWNVEKKVNKWNKGLFTDPDSNEQLPVVHRLIGSTGKQHM